MTTIQLGFHPSPVSTRYRKGSCCEGGNVGGGRKAMRRESDVRRASTEVYDERTLHKAYVVLIGIDHVLCTLSAAGMK